MIAPEDDIFYQQEENDDWRLLRTVYRLHEFPDNDKLVKAYLGFYDYLAIASAALSKHHE